MTTGASQRLKLSVVCSDLPPLSDPITGMWLGWGVLNEWCLMAYVMHMHYGTAQYL